MIAVVVTVIMADAGETRADAFGDAWGVVTDPFKLRSGTQNVLRAVQQARELEAAGNKDVQDRIEQLRLAIASSLDGVGGALQQIQKLEVDIFERFGAALRQSECTSQNINDQIQETIAEAFNRISDADVHIEAIGTTIGRLRAEKIQIKDPDKLYFEVKTRLLKDLEQRLKTDPSPMHIYTTYVNLKRLALKTQCSYTGVRARDFQLEATDLELKAAPWHELFLRYPTRN